jgi:hypothetical protein
MALYFASMYDIRKLLEIQMSVDMNGAYQLPV